MEKGKLITYWIATGLVSVGMLGSGIAQLFRTKDMIDLITPLGYPLYLLSILGTWKIL
ncbi:MAG: DoxX family protein, partial [Bacteroidia bacterium]